MQPQSRAHSSQGEQVATTGYLAAPGFLDELCAELDEVLSIHERLVIGSGPRRPEIWAQNIWHSPRRLRFGSIREAAEALRAMQRNWALYSVAHHRRAALIEAKLPHVSAKPLRFPEQAPDARLGSWTLVERDTLIAAPSCTSPFRHGEPRFVEDREGPPSRAYLKLWEALTLFGRYPRAGDRCLDLGASPGGWTWVLQGLGAEVVSVDKAPLESRVAALPGVRFEKGSAFSILPEAGATPWDWVVCDVICYPSRLLEMMRRWVASGACRHIVCTLKFQGSPDRETAHAFAEIPGGRLLHLHHNRHELTWLWATGLHA